METDLLTTILGQKTYHKGLLYKGIQSSITLPLNELFAVRLKSKDKNFLSVEIVSNGISNPLVFKVMNRPKVVAEKKKSLDSSQKELVEEELL